MSGTGGAHEQLGITDIGHGNRHIGRIAVGTKICLFGARRRSRTVNDLAWIGGIEGRALTQMADDLVCEEDNRSTILLGEVESGDGQIKAVLHGGGADGNDAVIAMHAVARLHQVGLCGLGGGTGGGTGALNVNDHAGQFGHNAETEVLLHQREARAGSGGVCLLAGEGSAKHSRHRGDLVLHLHI